MKLYKYRLDKGYLIPDENGDVTVLINGEFVIIYDKNGNEIKDAKFKYIGNEQIHLNKLKYIAKFINININENIFLAYPTFQERIITINKYMGKIFEDYVYFLLVSKRTLYFIT
jgi:hypothetical protein